jgi:2-C-methyl-D-erythritol 4-phosphate cytidylyltransferase
MEQTSVFSAPPPAHDDNRASAVIVAAGSSSRMCGISKQLAALDDMPVIAHSIKAFQAANHIRDIVLVSRPDDVKQFLNICRKYNFHKVRFILTGGETRQQSVFNGVRLIKDSAYFAIHDGARPLVRPDTIDKVVEYARLYGAATAAVPSKDTVKISDENSFVKDTPDRQFVWCIQTPQVFERKLYLNAIESNNVNESYFTDDCQLIEHFGHRVFLVKSEYSNIKITTPEDITIAECMLTNHISAD